MGSVSEAHHITHPLATGAGARRAMQLALEGGATRAVGDRVRQRARNRDSAERPDEPCLFCLPSL